MKALTVQQPWAWAIFNGKTIENRTQLWKYRGPLAIHAGNRWSVRGENSPLIRGVMNMAGAPHWITTGAIIGTVELVDVHPDVGCCKPWGESSYAEAGGRNRRAVTHLVLDSPRWLDRPIPCKGALGLWTPPPHVLDELKEANDGRP